jgi:hypothetical protein
MDLVEIGLDGVVWIGLAQDGDNCTALESAVTKLLLSQNAGKLWSGYTSGGISSCAQLHRVSYLVSCFEELKSWSEIIGSSKFSLLSRFDPIPYAAPEYSDSYFSKQP